MRFCDIFDLLCKPFLLFFIRTINNFPHFSLTLENVRLLKMMIKMIKIEDDQAKYG